MSEERQELAKHLNTRIGFSGFVSRLGVNRHVMIVSVSSPNDNNMLINHVWITIKQKEYDKLKIDDYITFSGLVVRYRKNNTDLVGSGGYGKRVGDYGIETVKNIEVKQMVNMIGSTTPYVTKKRPLVEKVKEQPVIIESTKKIPLKQLLADKKISVAILARKVFVSPGALYNRLGGYARPGFEDNFESDLKQNIANYLNTDINNIDFSVSSNKAINLKYRQGEFSQTKNKDAETNIDSEIKTGTVEPTIESDKEVKNTNSDEITQSPNRNIKDEYEEFKRFESFLKMKNGK